MRRWTLAALLGGGGLLLTAAGGCNALWGLGDLSYDAATSAGGSGGVGGNLGGHGGTGGFGGMAGAGTGGASSTGGTGGDGGGGGQAVVSFGERPTSQVTNVTADTYVDEGAPTDNYGAADLVRADRQPEQRGLLSFDLATIPTTAVVVAAELSLFTGDCSVCGTDDGTVELYPLLEAWREGTQTGALGYANWEQRNVMSDWADPGAGPSSIATAPAGQLTPDTPDTEYLVSLDVSVVQGWISDPSSNHGLRLSSTTASSDSVRFVSREGLAADKRPELRVTYQP
ncbi:MAG: DNRLRE domain-containing protein [Deltaproteobacteria bacterium]|jgi:hypothetical protein|nr:DNRLRE domain-containing protein [Deltaproteobacteria bacterium]MBW2530183.1 DNRLRE domain-containing protein [Deltaproteobacteria bacterium]